MRTSAILDPGLEQESAAARRARQGARLAASVRAAYAAAPGVRRMLDAAGVTPESIRGLDDLGRIPVQRKDDLGRLQGDDPPFGGLAGVAPSALARIFVSPGPIYDPQAAAPDFWRFGMALAAAGFRAGDIVQNTFAYHMTPAGFMFDDALRALGCVVIPAGTGQTDLQVRVAADLRATGYTGTPSFLHTLLTRARELGRQLALEVAFVSAERLPESLREELERDFGLRVLQGYGTADLGMLAYECPEKSGLHLHPEAIVEVLDRETGQPAVPGSPGELIATVFDPAYPLLRFATGDIVVPADDTVCACGRTAPRIAGIVGRVGDAVKVKGLFVRATQIAEALAAFPEVARFQATVTRAGHQDVLEYILEADIATADRTEFCARAAEALREQVRVRGDVRLVPRGTLAENAPRIDDRRVWN